MGKTYLLRACFECRLSEATETIGIFGAVPNTFAVVVLVVMSENARRSTNRLAGDASNRSPNSEGV